MLQTLTKPRFPESLHSVDPLLCPRLGRTSSVLTKRMWFYLHEWVLQPFSRMYCRFYGIQPAPAIYPLPFGLIIKAGERVLEREGLAMNLARAMGVPAPRFIAFAEPPPSDPNLFGSPPPSILMTRIPGVELDTVMNEVDLDVIQDDLVRILTAMRSFSSPWGTAICGVDGGPVTGPLVPASPLPASADEAAFNQQIREIGSFARKNPKDCAPVERMFARTHAVVFSHGDLNPHNILVGPDGHISGIFDWEAAAWFPDYWEVSVLAILPRAWGQFVNERVASGVYAEEVLGHRSMFGFISDSLSY